MLSKPGDAAPETGVYEVIHHHHRATHRVTATRGDIFPGCAVCDDEVRFRFLRGAFPIEADEDFR